MAVFVIRACQRVDLPEPDIPVNQMVNPLLNISPGVDIQYRPPPQHYDKKEYD